MIVAQVIALTSSGGVNTTGAITHDPDLRCAAFNGTQCFRYFKSDEVRPADHQYWMLTNSGNANLSNAYHAPAVADTSGVVYQLKWREIETSQGVYNLTPLINAANYLNGLGKKMIVRIFWKTYTDTADPPTNPQVPDYIKNDPATYGGTTNKGGLYQMWNGTSPFGWSARLDNANVNARFRALIDAIAGAVASNGALQGAMLDESTWSVYNSSTGLPSGLTSTIQIDTMKGLYSYLQSKFPGKEIYPNVNYTEGSDADTRALQQWCIDQGMLVGVTDTFRTTDMWRGKQPVYELMPRSTKTLVHVDHMSMGADDANLLPRMIENFRMTARLGANITVVYLEAGSSANHWLLAKQAMGIVG